MSEFLYQKGLVHEPENGSLYVKKKRIIKKNTGICVRALGLMVLSLYRITLRNREILQLLFKVVEYHYYASILTVFPL